MLDPLIIAAIGWALSPLITYLVNKSLDHLTSRPLKRASVFEADLNKLKMILPNILSAVSDAAKIKVVNQHQEKLFFQMMEAVCDAQHYISTVHRRYELTLEAEEAEARDQKNLIKRMKASFCAAYLQKSLSKSIKGWQLVQNTANAYIRKSNLQNTTDEGMEVKRNYQDLAEEHILTPKRRRETEADLRNQNKKIKGLEWKERAENEEGIPFYRERMESQIVESGGAPIKMCQYAKEVFDKSYPRYLHKDFSQSRFEHIAARMTEIAFEVGAAASNLWERSQQLDLIVNGKVPLQIEKKDEVMITQSTAEKNVVNMQMKHLEYEKRKLQGEGSSKH